MRKFDTLLIKQNTDT